MHRPLRHRAATLLLGLLYLLAWGEPVALHPCPMHDGAGVAAVVRPATPAHAAHAAHAPRGTAPHAAAAVAARATAGADAHAPALAHAAPHDDEGGHACQCLGHGCCAAALALPTAQHTRWFVAVTRRADPPAHPAPPATARAAARRLPPATGPPVLG